ncbi:MAG: protein-disulfide isomerase [Gammaproteobacteria bacterium]|nr:protein-disulfide isomerase [Gammaproteobacteria bacterium]|tara:strand:+ start:2332 stop:3072 length:741 start_codon:yes stop_codon:yes gene_type:complete
MAIMALAAAAAALTLPDALAEDDDGAAAEAAATLVSRLKALRPDIPIENVTASPIPGIYALELAGGTVFYGTEDGRYLFAGDLYQLGDDELVNLAEAGRAELRHELLAGVPRSEMIVFSPAGDTRAAINVFTDVDCGFCQKLHQEVPKLNEMGIEVRYLAYPRAGVGSESYRKIVSAWCAKDPNSALTKLKARQSIPDASCPNPVAEQLDLGRQMGVSGTPAIVLQDGTMLPGYMPAERLAEIVGL